MVAGSCPKAVIVAKPLFYRSGLSLGGQFWDLASTTSTVASTRLARLRLLPRQTKPPQHNGLHRTRKICHRPWNVTSTIRKAEPDKHNTKLDCIRNTGQNLQLFRFIFFLLHHLGSVFFDVRFLALGPCLCKCLRMHTRNGKDAYAGVFLG